jgi:HEAT repeat protein
MTAELLEIALKDVNFGVRKAAAYNCNMTAKLLEIALNDPDSGVREAAASNCNITVPLLELALKDPDSYVREVAEGKLKDINHLYLKGKETSNKLLKKSIS